MSHYQQLIADEIRSVQAQKDYCLSVLKAENLESWESKEYHDLVKQYDLSLINLGTRLSEAS